MIVTLVSDPVDTTTRNRPGIAHYLAWTLSIVGLLFLVFLNWDDFLEAASDTRWLWVVAAAMALVLGHWITAVLSSRAVQLDEGPVSVASAYRILASGLMTKYIPGGIWQFIGQWSQGRREGIDSRGTVRVWAEPTLALLSIGGMWACLAALAVPYPISNWVFVVGAVVMFLLSWPRIRRLLLIRVRLGGVVRASHRQWAIEFVLATLAVAASVAHGLAVVKAVAPGVDIGIEGAMVAFVGSWIVGFLAFPLPGGLGVREVVMTAALLPWLGPGEAAAIAILSRLASIGADLLTGLAGLGLDKKRGH